MKTTVDHLVYKIAFLPIDYCLFEDNAIHVDEQYSEFCDVQRGCVCFHCFAAHSFTVSLMGFVSDLAAQRTNTKTRISKKKGETDIKSLWYDWFFLCWAKVYLLKYCAQLQIWGVSNTVQNCTFYPTTFISQWDTYPVPAGIIQLNMSRRCDVHNVQCVQNNLGILS